jgi:hypothetical protein
MRRLFNAGLAWTVLSHAGGKRMQLGGGVVTRRHVRSQQEWHCLSRWEPTVKDRCQSQKGTPPAAKAATKLYQIAPLVPGVPIEHPIVMKGLFAKSSVILHGRAPGDSAGSHACWQCNAEVVVVYGNCQVVLLPRRQDAEWGGGGQHCATCTVSGRQCFSGQAA